MTHLIGPGSPYDNGKHVLYFGDPMCSWCWGFAPEFRRVINHVKGAAEFHIILTGLRPKASEPWTAELRAYIRDHWVTVAQTTNQPFDFSRFNDENFIYNTEPACRAIVTARLLNSSLAVEFFETVQTAFYAQGQDITNEETLADLAQSIGFDKAAFLHSFVLSTTCDLTRTDFQTAAAFDIRGYPSLLGIHAGQIKTFALGYQSFDAMADILDQWLNA